MTAHVKLLGSPKVKVGEAWLELPRGKTSALLYHLAYQGDWVSRNEIIYLFWPDLPEGQGRRNLRQLLSTTKRLSSAHGLEIEENRLRWFVPNDAQAFRRDRALEVFKAFKSALENELAGEPESETLRLIESIGQGKAPKVEAPLKAAQTKAEHALPLQPTPFIGRGVEKAQLAGLFDLDHRLITLIGPGGIGKTRLAIEAASLRSGFYGDGVSFVNLAPLTSPDYVVSAIAYALAETADA